MSWKSKLSVLFLCAASAGAGIYYERYGTPTISWPEKGPGEEIVIEDVKTPDPVNPPDANDDYIPDDPALRVPQEPACDCADKKEPEIAPPPAPPVAPPSPDLAACSALAQPNDTKTLTDPAQLKERNGAYFGKSHTLFLTTEDGSKGCVYNMRDKKFPIPLAAFDMNTQGDDYYAAMQKAVSPKVIISGSNPAPNFNIAVCAALGRENNLYERLNENKGKSRNDFLRSNDGQVFDKEQVFFVVLPEAPAKTACAYAYDEKNQHVPLAWFDMSAPDAAKTYYAERNRMSDSKTQRKNPSSEPDKKDAVMKFLKRHYGY